uniref:Uncharacterized protein n=1 Tax=Lepeophtheirus salmonis TaxID=72036 RepID=A0A0K2T8B0_LEPSM
MRNTYGVTFNPISVLAHFELNTIPTTKDVFPLNKVFVCFFLWVSRCGGKFKMSGLRQIYIENVDVLTKINSFVALLPKHFLRISESLPIIL